jgi:hypothetical protein
MRACYSVRHFDYRPRYLLAEAGYVIKSGLRVASRRSAFLAIIVIRAYGNTPRTNSIYNYSRNENISSLTT